MKFYQIALLCLPLILGCDNANDCRKETQKNANAPEIVCRMPDGRILHRFVVKNPGDHDHWVYYYDKGEPITINSEIRQGKTTRNQTIVIDGIPYKPAQ